MIAGTLGRVFATRGVEALAEIEGTGARRRIAGNCDPVGADARKGLAKASSKTLGWLTEAAFVRGGVEAEP